LGKSAYAAVLVPISSNVTSLLKKGFADAAIAGLHLSIARDPHPTFGHPLPLGPWGEAG